MESKWFARSLAALLAGCTALAVTSAASGQVVISQAWGGANISASAPNADYVELFNRGSAAQSLAGWSVQVASQGGASWRQVNLSGSIAPRSYYLVQVEPTQANGTPLPTPNASFVGAGGSPMSSLGGKVALKNDTVLLTTATPLPNAAIVDFLGYGAAATAFEGATRGPAGNTTGSGGTPTRKNNGCTDTNVNGSDFDVQVPAPRNVSSPVAPDLNEVFAVASPAAGIEGTSITLSLTVKNCGSANHPLTSPTVDLSQFGGSFTAPFGNSGGNVYTVNFVIPAGQAAGEYMLNYSANSPVAAVSGQYTITVASGNDVCAGAETIVLGTAVNGDNSSATDILDGPNPSCQASSHKGVWYKFVAPTSGIYELTTCGSGQDTIITIFTTPDCSTFTEVECDDDLCDGINPPGSGFASLINNANLTMGQLYHVRISSFGTAAAGGPFTLLIAAQVSGACCPANGACTVVTQTACGTGTFNGADTTCSPGLCPSFGACCNLSSFACTGQFQSNCNSPDTFQGDGSTCTPGICPPRPNDECGGAVTLSAGNGIKPHATTGGSTGADAASCGPLSNDVWYKWTAPASGNLRFWTEDFADGGYALWTGDCGALVEATCADSNGWMEFAVTGGTLYTIQVGQLAAAATPSAADAIELWFIASSVGACCNAGSCSILSQAECTGGASFLGAGTLCVPSSATISTYTGGTLTVIDYSGVTGGTFVTDTINVPDSFSVADIEVDIDANHTYAGDLLVTLSKGGRVVGLFNRSGRNATAGFGYFSDLTAGSPYTFGDAGADTVTNSNVVGPPATIPSGVYKPEYIGGLPLSFKDTFNGLQASGNWVLTLSDWGPGDIGAINSWTLRLTRGGTTNCTPSGTGRCCIGARCAITTAASCVASGSAGASFSSGASNCNGAGVLNTPCCFADFNKAGGITVQDVFDYLAAFFGNSVNANVSGDGVAAPTVQDIFDYLAAWFGGGCA